MPLRGVRKSTMHAGADQREANLKKEYFGEGAADDLDEQGERLLTVQAFTCSKAPLSCCRWETKYATGGIFVKIAVFVNTPAQVHFYKNIVAALEGDGNQVFILARDCGEDHRPTKRA